MPYMMAYAIEAGYKNIQIFGVEMSHDSEYAYQRPNMEYWIGIAKGKGINVQVPANCSLLRGDLYGFEDAAIAHQTFLSLRRTDLIGQQQEATKLAWEAQGTCKGLQQAFMDLVDSNPEDVKSWLAGKIQAADGEYATASSKLEHIQGSLDEISFIMKWSQDQNRPADRLFVEEKSNEKTSTPA
jgi:hypothetical protein